MTNLSEVRDLVRASDVVIVGAGVAGLATALLLQAKGLNVTMIERYEDPRFTERVSWQTINLALSHRGIRTLREIGAFDALADVTVPMYGRMVHDAKADNFQPYDEDSGSAIFSVRRSEIIHALLNLADRSANLRIYFGCSCHSIDFKTKTLTLEDRETGQKLAASFKTLIGADGCHSAVRQAIAQATGTKHSIQCLEHGFKDIHLDSIVASSLQKDRTALHIWPFGEFMLIALPNPDRSFTATLFMPHSGALSFEALSHGMSSEFLRGYLPRHEDLIPALSAEIRRGAVGKLLTVTADSWHFGGSALIIGDAAHAISPFLGQGMNCALEDCRLLAEYFDRESGDWSNVFQTFEAERRRDTDAVALMSKNNYIEMRKSVREESFCKKREIYRLLKLRHPDRFLPLYSMVTFTSIGYSEAFERHCIQAEIVDKLSTSAGPIDFQTVDSLITKRLCPLPNLLERHKLEYVEGVYGLG